MHGLARPLTWPIRVRLGIVVLVGMASMAIAIGALMFSTANALFARQARADLQRQNQAVANEIDNLTDRAATSLLIARNTPAFERYFEVDQSDQPAQAAALHDIQHLVVYLQNTFAIDEICVIDTDGAEQARGVLGELAPEADLSDAESENPFFAPTLALGNGEVYRSTEPYVSPDTHRWVVAHATPIVLANGHKVGLLHFEIPLEWFAAKLRGTSLAGASSFLLDRDGQVLVHKHLGEVSPDPEERVGNHHGEPGVGFPHAPTWGSPGFRNLAASILQNGGGTAAYDDGEEGFEVVYQPVFDGRWIVATELPHSVIYEPGTQLLRETLIIVAPLLSFAVMLMVWYSARLLAPLRRLAKALGAIGAGQLHQTAGISGEDEIGELGRSFDKMAAELQTSLHRRVEIEAALQHQALHDHLTRLPNRAWLQNRLDQAVAFAERDQRPWALLLLDLDRFKEVNDTLGHDVGDRLLQEIARRLESELRTCDAVARLGGDEFAILLGDTDEVTAPRVVSRLIELLEAPMDLDGRDVVVGASIGIALYPNHGQDVATLMRRADIAMYVAKRTGSGFAISTAHLEQPATERLARIGALRQAISSEQLVLYYQPMVDCHTQALVAFEALVRWHHPQHGLVMPDHFIPCPGCDLA
ncbi:MAG: diguanylate cyclase [Chloroflexi bacterium]|nr:diguanylate cyclase [Chloroflexota bacterium]